MQTVVARLKTVTRLNPKMKSENKIASIPLLTPQNRLSDFILQKSSILDDRRWSFIELFYKKEYDEDLEPPIYRNQYINNELYLNFHIDNKSNREVYSPNNIQAIKKINHINNQVITPLSKHILYGNSQSNKLSKIRTLNLKQNTSMSLFYHEDIKQSIEEFENNNKGRKSDPTILINQIKRIQSSIIEEIISQKNSTKVNSSLETNQLIVEINQLSENFISQLQREISNKIIINSKNINDKNQLISKEQLFNSYEAYLVKVQRVYNTFVKNNAESKAVLRQNTITSFSKENIRNRISNTISNKNALSLFYPEALKDSVLELEKSKKDVLQDTLELISEIKNIQSNIIEEVIKENKNTKFNTSKSLEINKFIVAVNQLSNSLISQLEKQTTDHHTVVNSKEKINIASNKEINGNQPFIQNEELINNYEAYLVKVQRLYSIFVKNNVGSKALLKQNTITSFNRKNVRNSINNTMSLFYPEALKDSVLELEKSKKDVSKDALELINQIKNIQSDMIEEVIKENKDTKFNTSKSLEINKFIVGVKQLSNSLIRQLEKQTTDHNRERINIQSNKEISNKQINNKEINNKGINNNQIDHRETINYETIDSEKLIENNQRFIKNEELINNYEAYLLKVQRLYNTFVQNNGVAEEALKQNAMIWFNTRNKISNRHELSVFGSEENISSYDIYKNAPISLFYYEELNDSVLEFEKSKKDISKDALELISEIKNIQGNVIEEIIKANKNVKVDRSKSLEINKFIVEVNQLSNQFIRQLEKQVADNNTERTNTASNKKVDDNQPFTKNEELVNNYEEYLLKIYRVYSTFIASDKSIKMLSSRNIMSLFNNQRNKLKISHINSSNVLNSGENISGYAIYNGRPISLFYHEDIKESDAVGRNSEGVHSSMLNKMLLTKKVYQAIQIYEQNLTVAERENTRLEKNKILKEKIGVNHQSFFEGVRNTPINLTQGQINKLDVKEGKMVVVLPKLNFEKHSESEMMILVPPGYSNQPAYPNASNQLFNGNMNNQANYNAPINKASTDYVTDFKANKASKAQNEVKSINEQMKTNMQKLKQTVNYDIGQLERGQMTKLVDTVYKQIEERLIRERRRSGL